MLEFILRVTGDTMLKRGRQQVFFTQRQLEQLETNEIRLRNAIRVSLLELMRFVSSRINERACVQALAMAGRQMRYLLHSCEQIIAGAREQKPAVIIVSLCDADPDDTSNNLSSSAQSSSAYGNRGGQNPNLDNQFNGTERRTRCVKWEAELTRAVESVQRIEDILFIHSTERHVRHGLFIALASLLSALERQRRYLLETQAARQPEIRVEFDGDNPTGETTGLMDSTIE